MSLDTILATIPERLGDRRQAVQSYFEEKCFVETVCYVWYNVYDDDVRQAVEKAVLSNDTGSIYYKLFVDEYDVKTHFSQVCSHRIFIRKAYKRLRPYLHHMKLEDVEKHDLTKFTFAQAVGYTARWVHNIDNDAWKKALQHHYDNEPHHPQYFIDGKMTPRYLEESLVDMVASRWERQLQGEDNVSDFDLVDFDSKFLLRYHSEDLETVKKIIKEIQDGVDNITGIKSK